ncbi:unnamed protein product [Pseudo-nitzschia multistriata]|uniref:Uncharacterized protein n=1 Tax=Pseudo-nitzschia multistriata TaxID=183589 RepID=A0A448ZST4_9STRA|nr:unnamed protein product [Pseudo-nitzschia multistriata]
MGLFTTLASATGANNSNSEGDLAVRQTDGATATSSATIPTVVQLYSGQQIILMEDTPSVSGYTSLTYQAVQVGASRDDAVAAELKHRHANPDLGVWNCRVGLGTNENSGKGGNSNSGSDHDPLVDSLLAKLAQTSSSSSSSSTPPPPPVYCLTVDLSDETTVEPTLSALQAALVRHLIEHPPPAETKSEAVRTTSLYDLQTVQFGLAPDEPQAERSIEEEARNARVGLMVCAVVSSSDARTADESSEAAYKKKQARALVVYHLRKFACSIHAALCFVERPGERKDSSPNTDASDEKTGEDAATGSGSSESNAQRSVSYDKLSQLWRDMANGIQVWNAEAATSSAVPAPESESAAAAAALYGPGRQQEDLIESVLLRNANYPGHWDAAKDSLWVALPSEPHGGQAAEGAGAPAAGDDGWLTQLRDSIASALPVASAEQTDKNKAAAGKDGGADKPKEKDAAVSSFFESLLKDS